MWPCVCQLWCLSLYILVCCYMFLCLLLCGNLSFCLLLWLSVFCLSVSHCLSPCLSVCSRQSTFRNIKFSWRLREDGSFSGGEGKSVTISIRRFETTVSIITSVGEPDPEPNQEPQDPHVFGPPGSFPFLINVLNGLNNACKIKF